MAQTSISCVCVHIRKGWILEQKLSKSDKDSKVTNKRFQQKQNLNVLSTVHN